MLTIQKLARTFPVQAARDLLAASPTVQSKILEAYQLHSDGKGRRRREVTCPPNRGNSRKYPWR